MEIKELSKRPGLFEKAVRTFWEQWGNDSNFTFYEDCMRQSCLTDSSLPRFYIALEEDQIVGTYALLSNDINSRQDLCPWLACLWVHPDFRRRQLGKSFLDHGLQEAAKKGFSNLYLSSDLDGYYEKYGWKREGLAFGPLGDCIPVFGKQIEK